MLSYSSQQLKFRVDVVVLILAEGLAKITTEATAAAMQVSEANPMVGIDGRTSLLQNLSEALKASPQYFGANARPGNLVGTHTPSHLLYQLSDPSINIIPPTQTSSRKNPRLTA